MADYLGTGNIKINVDTGNGAKSVSDLSAKINKALESTKLEAESFTNKWDNLTSGIKDTKRIVSGILVSQAFYTLSNSLITVSASAATFTMDMEKAAISMEYFVKGADKAAQAAAYLKNINVFAARTPFSTKQALELSKYMQAMGIAMNNTKSVLQTITDTASATGATEENMQRIVFGLGQIKTKGRLANEEIRQLANANIPIYEILQEQLGLTGDEISKIGSNWVDADKAVVAILRGLESRYKGAADRVSDTMSGMLQTVGDNSLIIGQVVTSGVYDKLSDKLTTLRDNLDKYRETATEKGGIGLFREIALDIDATGALGTHILALIGNFRVLGSTLSNLMVTAKPVFDTLGYTGYAVVSTLSYGITSLASVTNMVISTFTKFGVTSEVLGTALASLFISYQVGKAMAFLGEGASAAIYNMYSLVNSAFNVVPALATASLGVKALTASIAGLTLAGLTVAGVFTMVNNALAGLDSSKAGSLPTDFETAYAKYEKDMEEYNKRLDKYNETFNSPFSQIAESGADAFAAVSDASKEASAAVKKDWVASFDEVFTMPDNSTVDALSSLANTIGSASLGLGDYSYKFPSIKEDALVKPKFDMNSVLQGSALQPVDGDFLRNLLLGAVPIAIVSAMVKAGKVFPAQLDDKKSGSPDEAVKYASGLAGEVDIGKAAKRTMNMLDTYNSKIAILLSDLDTLAPDAKALRIKQLDKLIEKADISNTQLKSLNDLYAKSYSIDTSSIDAARKTVAEAKLTEKLDSFIKLQNNLAIDKASGKLASDVLLDDRLKELSKLTKAISTDYEAYSAIYGKTALSQLMNSSNFFSSSDKQNVLSDAVKTLDETYVGIINSMNATNLDSGKAFSEFLKDLDKVAVQLEAAGLGLSDNLAILPENRKLINETLMLVKKYDKDSAEFNSLKFLVEHSDAIPDTATRNATKARYNEYATSAGADGKLIELKQSIDNNVNILKTNLVSNRELLSAGLLQIKAQNALDANYTKIANLTKAYMDRERLIQAAGKEYLTFYTVGQKAFTKANKTLADAIQANKITGVTEGFDRDVFSVLDVIEEQIRQASAKGLDTTALTTLLDKTMDDAFHSIEPNKVMEAFSKFIGTVPNSSIENINKIADLTYVLQDILDNAYNVPQARSYGAITENIIKPLKNIKGIDKFTAVVTDTFRTVIGDLSNAMADADALNPKYMDETAAYVKGILGSEDVVKSYTLLVDEIVSEATNVLQFRTKIKEVTNILKASMTPEAFVDLQKSVSEYIRPLLDEENFNKLKELGNKFVLKKVTTPIERIEKFYQSLIDETIGFKGRLIATASAAEIKDIGAQQKQLDYIKKIKDSAIPKASPLADEAVDVTKLPKTLRNGFMDALYSFMSGTDYGSTRGITAFGKVPQEALLSNVDESTVSNSMLARFLGNESTTASKNAMLFGNVSESYAIKALEQIMGDAAEVTAGATRIAKDAPIQTQIDAFVKLGEKLIPTDVKTMGQDKFGLLLDAIKENGTLTFADLKRILPEYAYQFTAQAAATDSKTIGVAALNRDSLVTLSKHTQLTQEQIEDALIKGFEKKGAIRKGEFFGKAIANDLKFFTVDIPNAEIAQAKKVAKQFLALENILSTFGADDASKYISSYLVNGTKVNAMATPRHFNKKSSAWADLMLGEKSISSDGRKMTGINSRVYDIIQKMQGLETPTAEIRTKLLQMADALEVATQTVTEADLLGGGKYRYMSKSSALGEVVITPTEMENVKSALRMLADSGGAGVAKVQDTPRMLKTLSNIVDELSTYIKDGTFDVSKISKEMQKVLKSKIYTAGGALLNVTDNSPAAKRLMNTLEDMRQQLSVGSGAVDGLALNNPFKFANFDETFKFILKDISDDLAKGIVDGKGILNSIDEAKKIVKGNKEVIGLLDNLYNSISGLNIKDAGTAVKRSAAEVAKLKQAWAEMTKAFNFGEVDAATGGFAIPDEINDLAKSMNAAADEVADTFNKAVADTVDNVAEIFDGMAIEAANTVKKVTTSATNAAETFIEVAGNVTEGMSGASAELGEQIGEAATKGLKKVIEEVASNTLGKMTTETTEAIVDIYNGKLFDAEQFTTKVIKGMPGSFNYEFAQAIREGSSGILNAVYKNLADAVAPAVGLAIGDSSASLLGMNIKIGLKDYFSKILKMDAIFDTAFLGYEYFVDDKNASATVGNEMGDMLIRITSDATAQAIQKIKDAGGSLGLEKLMEAQYGDSIEQAAKMAMAGVAAALAGIGSAGTMALPAYGGVSAGLSFLPFGFKEDMERWAISDIIGTSSVKKALLGGGATEAQANEAQTANNMVMIQDAIKKFTSPNFSNSMEIQDYTGYSKYKQGPLEFDDGTYEKWLNKRDAYINAKALGIAPDMTDYTYDAGGQSYYSGMTFDTSMPGERSVEELIALRKAFYEYTAKSGDYDNVMYDKWMTGADDKIKSDFGAVYADWIEANKLVNENATGILDLYKQYTGRENATKSELLSFLVNYKQAVVPSLTAALDTINKYVDADTKVVTGYDSTLAKDAADMLSRTVGITLTDISNSLVKMTAIDITPNEQTLAGLRIDPSTDISIGDISVESASILAKAGIQVNTDGSVTFMKPVNSNEVGTSRISDVSKENLNSKDIQTLSGAGVSFSDTNTLDLSKLASKAQSAYFKLSDASVSGQLSAVDKLKMANVLNFTDDGFVEVKDAAYLSGKKSIEAYMKGFTDDKQVLLAMSNLDKALKTGMSETATLLKVNSPFTKDSLSDELKTMLKSVGITFQEEGDKMYMLVNTVNDKVKKGITSLTEKEYAALGGDLGFDKTKDSPIIKTLRELGVDITRENGLIQFNMEKVFSDVANSPNKIIELYYNNPTLWNKLPENIRNMLGNGVLEMRDGMLVLNQSAISGMLNLNGTYVGYGETLKISGDKVDTEMAAWLEKLGVNTTEGFVKVKGFTEEQVSKLTPEVKKALVPYAELPTKMKEYLLAAGGEDVKKQWFEVSKTTKEAAFGVVDVFNGEKGINNTFALAVKSMFGAAVTEAEEGTKNLAYAIAQGMLISKQFEKIQSGKNSFVQAKRANYTYMGADSNGEVYKGYELVDNGKTLRFTTPDGLTGWTAPSSIGVEAFRAYLRGKGVPGAKHGALIGEDAIYRAGEFGLNEAVVPLEQPAVLKKVGNAIATNLPTREMFAPLKAILGMESAGISTTSRPQQQQAPSKEDFAKSILEIVLPAMSTRTQEKQPLYVGTLVADDNGIRELGRKMKIIDVSEDRRKGR